MICISWGIGNRQTEKAFHFSGIFIDKLKNSLLEQVRECVVPSSILPDILYEPEALLVSTANSTLNTSSSVESISLEESIKARV